MSAAKRVMIIGWDCAFTQLLDDEWLARMPNFAKLVKNGTYGPMRSSDPPITVPAWTSMFSSRNPGQLGFFGFRNRRIGEYEGKWIATSNAVKVPRIWNIASDAGRRCCIFNVPQTFPVSEVNGIMVSSFLTPSTDSEYTYPRELAQELDRVTGGYMIDCENFRTNDKAALLEQIHAMTDKRFIAAKHMLAKEPWDLFAMVYMGSDRLHHGFWKFHDPDHPKYTPGNPFEDAITSYYAKLDAQLGELMEMADEDTAIFVVSDHGAKAMKGCVNINDWLIDQGLLVLKEPVEEPQRFDESLVDWSQTKVWAWGGYYSRVFFNVEGREPQGTIPADEYDDFRAMMIERIEAIPDDQGRPMNTMALKAEDLYTGSHVDEAPDLMVYFDALSWRVGQDIGNEAIHTFDTEIGPDDAVHDFEGIYVSNAPGRTETGQRQGLQLMDVAPTVLDVMGIATPRDMEGSSIYSSK